MHVQFVGSRPCTCEFTLQKLNLQLNGFRSQIDKETFTFQKFFACPVCVPCCWPLRNRLIDPWQHCKPSRDQRLQVSCPTMRRLVSIRLQGELWWPSKPSKQE